MDRASQAAPGVDSPGQLERLRPTNLADDDQVGSHGEGHLDQIAQADLSGPVEGRRARLVVRPMNQRDMQLADFLTGADTVIEGDGGDER